MKKKFVIVAFILVQFLTATSFAQNIGINTETPQARLHIFKGSSGYIGVYPHQDLIVESNDHAWINLLAPNNKETGLLFGKPSHIASGGIVYDVNNNLHFRTNGNVNRMFIGADGKVGIGTNTPIAPLSFPAVLGSKITLYPGASGDVGIGVQGNLLQIYSDYAGAAVAFGYGGSNSFHENMRIQGTGNVGIGTSTPGTKLDVAGNVRASEFDYITPREFWYSIPAAGFSSYNGNKLFKETLGSYDGAYFGDHHDYYEYDIMVATVNLPHHATVKRVTSYYYDGSWEYDINVSLYRKDHTGAYELMGKYKRGGLSWTPGDRSDNLVNPGTLTEDLDHPLIDNAAYSYHVRAFSDGGGAGIGEVLSYWPGSELRVKAIVITYTLSRAQ
jgi:hypothetical protein